MSGIITIIATIGPLIDKWWPAIEAVLKAAQVLKQTLNLNPSDALKAAAEIQLRIRPADATEAAALKAGGMLEADSNHDFPYVMS